MLDKSDKQEVFYLDSIIEALDMANDIIEKKEEVIGILKDVIREQKCLIAVLEDKIFKLENR